MIKSAKEAADAGEPADVWQIAQKAGAEVAGKIKPERTDYAKDVLSMVRQSRIKLTQTHKIYLTA